MDIHPIPSILQKQKELFCQTFSRTASAPLEELLLQRSQSRSHFQRSQSPTKQALNWLRWSEDRSTVLVLVELVWSSFVLNRS